MNLFFSIPSFVAVHTKKNFLSHSDCVPIYALFNVFSKVPHKRLSTDNTAEYVAPRFIAISLCLVYIFSCVITILIFPEAVSKSNYYIPYNA